MQLVPMPRVAPREYCHAKSKDGDICALYKDHKSEEHVSNHGHKRWKS